MEALAWTLVGFAAGGALVFHFMRRRTVATVASALSQHANGLRAKMDAIDARHQHATASTDDSALTVVTCPYQEHAGDKSFWGDSRRVETGYLLQVFVNGAPCLAPHKVPLQVLVQGQVTPARLEAASKSALQLTESLAAFHPRIRAVRDPQDMKGRVAASA